MPALNARQFNKFYWLLCTTVLVVLTLRCALVPFAHDEVATFNFYIQPGSFIPFMAHVDAMGHFLTCATEWCCFKLFGSSTLALRLPNILAFMVLCFGVFRLLNLCSRLIPKLIITSAFIFSYHFIGFFGLIRGYGMSMAFLSFALYYFICYARHLAPRHFTKFILFSQLALSANLTLVFVVLVCTAMLLYFQLGSGRFFSLSNLLLLLLHAGLTAFWIKFAFFLKESGALYYGAGESYLKVTFVSLIATITLKSKIMYALAAALFVLMSFFFVRGFLKHRMQFLRISHFGLLFSAMCVLMLSFYLLKKFFGVNYPEDRAALFFYLFFMLSLAYAGEEFVPNRGFIFFPVPVFFAAHFIMALNFRVHPWPIYETVPARFFEKLATAQAGSKQPVSIAGLRMTEFLMGFFNYNSTQKISHLTAPEALQMNCDYAIAYKQDSTYYQPYYDEIDREDDWGYRLLKRKQPLEREALLRAVAPLYFKGAGEYYNLFEQLDTTLNFSAPLTVEIELSVKQAPEPFNAWLVLEVNDATGTNRIFVRTPLNMVYGNWNGVSHFKTSITTGTAPQNIKRMVCYLWNIDKKELDITIDSYTLCRIKGEGVNQISKAAL